MRTWCYYCGDRASACACSCDDFEEVVEPELGSSRPVRRSGGWVSAANWIAVVGIGIIIILICAVLAAASAA